MIKIHCNVSLGKSYSHAGFNHDGHINDTQRQQRAEQSLVTCGYFDSVKIQFLGIPLVVQWLGVPVPSAGGPGSILGQEARSHMLQLKTLHVTTKTQCSQRNKSINEIYL